MHPDLLVLELGGQSQSLRGTLTARGVQVPVAHRAQQVEPTPQTLPQPVAQPQPVPTPEPQFVVVKLERGQTLMHLSQQYLGTTRRWREILTLNGWSEADASKLREGLAVRVPRQ